MFFSKGVLTTLFAFLAVASAAPTELETRNVDASATISLCTAIGFAGTCVRIAVVSDQCINFTGGLTILNKEISSAVIPDGFICDFFQSFGCLNAGSSATDEVALQGGQYPDFRQLNGIFAPQNFNDLASSISCSPV